MEVKAGYKQTDVGVIPSDWSAKTIATLCKLVNGRGFKPYEWSKEGLPIIRIQNLNGSPDFNFYSGQYDPKILVENGQLLFAWSGSRGTSFGPHVWQGNTALLNYHTWKLVVNPSEVRKDFFLYALKQLTAVIEKNAHGASALVHTQKWVMEKYSVAVPSSDVEQQAIAKALSDVDELIASLDALIAKKRDLKQASMQQLLTGKTRLQGFSEEWIEQELGSVCRIVTGKRDVNEGNASGQYPFFTCARDHTYSDHFSFDCEAVLIAGNGEVGNLSYYNGKFEAYQRTYVLHSWTMNIQYVWYQLQENLKTSLGIGAIGTSIPYIKKPNLTSFRFLSPVDLSEQSAIANVLSNMDTELSKLDERRDKTIALKQGMMQELLTGRTRLV